MSAPVAVNTADGTCWTRRGETRRGEALYAPEGVCNCPPFVMATLSELAEHGIVGSAYALPMPVGPERKSRGVLDRARDAVDARMSKDALRHVLQNVIAYAAELERERNGFRGQRNNLVATNEQLHDKVTETFEARLRAENETRTVKREFAEAAATVARLVQERGERMKVENALRDEAEELRARVAELEAAAKEIQRLHTDSPMGPCPVCIDGDAMVRGDDYTLPYPCPTARLAGAKDCDPPSQREDPCHPCGCPKRFDRHADGCPTLAAAEGGDAR